MSENKPVAIAPEPQHTPGPWAFDSDREYFYSRSADFDNGEPFSAQIFKCPEEETPSLEDAYLIAAAPDMLSALKEVVRVVGGTLQGYTDYSNMWTR